ncbi:MAG: hypothetical protein QOG53_2677 [Frankiales bacterium]|jgi:hypothetical protein|nr:hypothetical protein [Frankiales bacterium]
MSKTGIAKVTMVLVVGAMSLVACSSNGSTASSDTPNPQATTASPTPAAAAQTVTITPDTGLKNGQVVQVVGKGYTAGKQYGVTECGDKGAATGAGDCDLRGIKVGTADPSGTVTVAFPVAKGPFGTNNINCSVAPGCIISVANAGTAAPTEVAATKITFA